MIKNISVIIPTFKREQVLLDTLSLLIKQIKPGDEILVMDQTQTHESGVDEQLAVWNVSSAIRWMRLQEPSVTKSMNLGAIQAKNDLLLFLDDDIVSDSELLESHKKAYQDAQDSNIWAVVGRVTQPWQSDSGQNNPQSINTENSYFDFNSTLRQFIQTAIGCNMSVLKSKFLALGGFDENFKGVAYRFETEFAERVIEMGGKVLFEPSAYIKHLYIKDGGTRFFGDHATTLLPYHSVGGYYYIFRSGKKGSKTLASAKRFFRALCKKAYLSRPWLVICCIIAETSGFFWAVGLNMLGPRLIQGRTASGAETSDNSKNKKKIK